VAVHVAVAGLAGAEMESPSGLHVGHGHGHGHGDDHDNGNGQPLIATDFWGKHRGAMARASTNDDYSAGVGLAWRVRSRGANLRMRLSLLTTSM
jgi:hypothetical protein